MLLDALRLPFALAPRFSPRRHVTLLRRERGRFALDPWLASDADPGLTRARVHRHLADLAPGATVVVGESCEAWPLAEAWRGLTRAALEAFLPFSGFSLELTTSSPGIARDAALLGQLDRENAVAIWWVVDGADAAAAAHEPIAALSAEGLEVTVVLGGSGWVDCDAFAVVHELRLAGASQVVPAEGTGSGEGLLRAACTIDC